MLALSAKGYVSTSALATHLVIASTPGAIISTVAGQIDASAPTATYYLQLIDSAAAVNGGSAITPIAIIIAAHTSGTVTTFSFADSFPIGGIAVNAGCVLQLSTTYGVGMLAGAYLNAAAAR
jgi:hypothetical protein